MCDPACVSQKRKVIFVVLGKKKKKKKSLTCSRPLVFIATASQVGAGGSEGLCFNGAHVSRFSPFNIADPCSSTFWFADDPFAFPVAPFSGLASAPSVGHILARAHGTSDLLSSHPFSSSAPRSSVVPVVCCLSLPVLASSLTWRTLSIWEVRAPAFVCPVPSSSAEFYVQLRVCGSVQRSSAQRSCSWSSAVELVLPEPAVGEVELSIFLAPETMLARGGLSLDFFSSAARPCEVDMFDATGALLSWRLLLQVRSSIAPPPPWPQDAVLALLGRDAAPPNTPPVPHRDGRAPPPVPARPNRQI